MKKTYVLSLLVVSNIRKVDSSKAAARNYDDIMDYNPHFPEFVNCYAVV